MRFFEVIVDWALDTKLMEMAFERKSIIKKCRDLSMQIASHMVKVAVCPDDINVNHWKNEIHGWLSDIDNMVFNNKKKLSGHDYYKLLFVEPCGTLGEVEQLIDNMVRHRSLTKTMVTANIPVAFETIEKAYHNISFDIANKNYGHIDEYI